MCKWRILGVKKFYFSFIAWAFFQYLLRTGLLKLVSPSECSPEYVARIFVIVWSWRIRSISYTHREKMVFEDIIGISLPSGCSSRYGVFSDNIFFPIPFRLACLPGEAYSKGRLVSRILNSDILLAYHCIVCEQLGVQPESVLVDQHAHFLVVIHGKLIEVHRMR